jgi:putative sterol carrier protein
LEGIFTEKAKAIEDEKDNNKDILILCDRSSLDGLIYMELHDFKAMIEGEVLTSHCSMMVVMIILFI